MTALLEPPTRGPRTTTMNFGGTMFIPGAGLSRRPNGHFVITVDIEFPPNDDAYASLLHRIPVDWECYDTIASEGFDSHYYGPEGYEHDADDVTGGGDPARRALTVW